MMTRWEVVTVRKSELDTYLAEGWEPVGASMVQSTTFSGQPVLREFWHLRRALRQEEIRPTQVR